MLSKRVTLGLGFAICLYAIVVLGYAQQVPEIGLACAFGTKVQRVDYKFIPSDFSFPQPPKEGDEVVQVANIPIQSWSAFLRTVSRLREDSLFPRTKLGPTSSVVAFEQEAQQGRTVVERNNQEYVRVTYRLSNRPGEIGHCWCLVGTPPPSEFLPSLAWFFVKLGIFLIGAVVYWRRPHDEAAYRFFLLCICSVGAFMGGYHWLRIASSPVLIFIFMICAMLLPVVSLHFYLVYPTKKQFLVRHPYWTKSILYGPTLMLLGLMMVTLSAVIALYRLGYSPETVAAWSQLLLREIYVAIGLAAIGFLACLVTLFFSYRDSLPMSQARNQVKWLLTGALLASVPVAYTLYLGVTRPEKFGLGAATWPMFSASLFICIAYAASISRYGLMEIREVLNLSMLSLGASVAAGLLYTGVVFLGMFLLDSREIALSPLWQAAWVCVTAWIVLSALHMSRNRLRAVLHRRLHRTKFQLDQTLRRMNEAVEQRLDPQVLCRRYLAGLAELASFEQGAIYLRQGEPPIYRLITHLGEEPPLKELPPGSPLVDTLQQSPFLRLRPTPGTLPLEPALRQLKQLHGVTALPLRHEGLMLAVLLVGPMEGGEADIDALHLLTTFAQIGGLALHGTQGHEQMEQLSRELQTKVEQVAEQQRRIVALQSQLQRQNVVLAEPLLPELPAARMGNLADAPGMAPVGQMVGSGEAMRHLQHLTRKVAISPSAVLIRGESGTGKELLAKALHDWGPRANGPFVKVHCAALSPGLLESELFGHVKGAFTGAIKDKVGRFEMADGGTLFLDEIGDINLEIQTKLLRVLQEMAFERVGSSTPILVDVRVVAATNQDLEKLMKEGRFREDLFFRLNVITLRTPSLRERREDIIELALHFLRIYAAKNGKPGLVGMDDDVLVALKSYAWPGNIRELENVIERAAVLADGASITLTELPDELRRETRGAGIGLDTLRLIDAGPSDRNWQAQVEEQERRRLVQALAGAAGNKARAARALGLPRSTFVSKLEKFGLIPKRA